LRWLRVDRGQTNESNTSLSFLSVADFTTPLSLSSWASRAQGGGGPAGCLIEEQGPSATARKGRDGVAGLSLGGGVE